MGVIGAGYGERVILPALKMVPRFEAAAVCATTDKKAADVARRHGIPKSYSDWKELVSDPGIDAVAIAVPPALQPKIALAAVAEGKALFLEKPLGTDLASVKKMAEAAARAKVPAVVDFELCEIPAWVKARDFLHRGGIGTPRQVSVNWQIETYALKHNLDTWKHREKDGGGVALQFTSHTLNYLEWFMGPAKRLSARFFGVPGKPDKGKTLAHYSIEFASGAAGAAVVGTDAFLGSGHRLEFYGDKGALIVENPGPDHVWGFRLRYGARATGNYLADAQPPAPKRLDDGRIPLTAAILSRLARAIDHGDAPTPSLKQGLRVQELLEAAEESDRKRAWVECAP